MIGSLLSSFSRALVLAPHTDDEYGCAGLMVRLRDVGVRVKYVALSKCEESIPEHLPKDVLVRECRACTECLGVPAEDVHILDFKVRHFPRDRQEILQQFVDLNREYRPELVILPTSHDTHQDHATVYQEGFRAFKHSTILGYELPQNLTSFNNSAFVALTSAQVDKKIAGLTHYESQAFRRYATGEFIRGLAKVRGVQCNSEYAEAYEVVRLIIR